MTDSMRLYHGSGYIVERPELAKGKPYNDYGRGFYCAEHIELAREWACSSAEADGYVNEYLLDTQGLAFLNLSDGRFCILHWLSVLMQNRVFDLSLPVAREGARYLSERFSVDLSPYDIVVGYRADDSYFSFARAFLQNAISVEQLSRAMRLGELGEQVVLKSERAFERIHFAGAQPVSSDIYYAKRKFRDDRARAAYRAEAERQGLDGLYLRDIIQGNIGADDERLR